MKTTLERYMDGGRVAYRLVTRKLVDGLDLAFLQKTDGVGRDLLESRIRALCAEVEGCERTNLALSEALGSVQALSTRQCDELRTQRAVASLSAQEAKFIAEAVHELALARAKYPGPETIETLLLVIGEESGETQRAYLHKEGDTKIRQEAAQVVATCIRLVVEAMVA